MKLALMLGLAAAALGCSKDEDKPTPDKSRPVDRKPVDPGPASDAAPKPSGGGSASITLEYSTEKKDWIEGAVAEFGKQHPDIKVTLVAKGSLDAAQAILDGTDKPDVWSPADSMIANLLASDWQTKNSTPLFPTSGDAAPQPLLLSPLVFAVWEDRGKVLVDGTNGQLSWKTVHKAVASPKGWPAIGGKPAWGFVKLGHTDPNRSNSGVQALVLMGLEHFGTQTLTVENMLDQGFQQFVKEIESSVPRFEASTGTFMTDMIRFGPSKYDIAVVYESLAISELEHAQGRWGSLHVYYPPVTIWSDHPIVTLDAPWATADKKKAAGALVAFLKSKPVQTTALKYGFRPADTSVPLKSSDAANPFPKMAQYGVTIDVPTAAQPPDGAVVRNLLMMWSRVVKK